MSKRIFFFICGSLLSILFVGCSSSRRIHTSPERKGYNREAMHHIINGAIEDLLGQPKNALVEYHQAAEIDTTSSGIYLAIAENYYYLEEYNSSIRMLKKALQREPNNMDAWELMAANHEQLRQYREAALAYERMIKIEPDNILSLYTLTSLQIIIKDFTKALQSYRRLVAAGLADNEYRLRIGHLFFQNRAFDQAADVYVNIYRTDPDYEPAYLALAALSKVKQDTASAIHWYKSALEQNSFFEEAKAELRQLLEKRNQLDEAIEIYRDLVARDGSNITDKLQLGQYYFQQGDTAQAIDWIQQIITQHPQSERGYLALAAVKKIQKDTLAAEKIYLSALAQNVFFLDARRRLRDLYADHKRWDEAIALYEPVKDIDTTFVGARIEVANLLLQKGDTLKAIQLCEELQQTHGQDWRVTLTLGRFLMLQREYLKAQIHFDKTVTLRDDFALVWVLRGLNYLQTDSLEAAEKNFIAAMEKFPQDPEISYYLGLVYNRANKVEKAIEFLEKSNRMEEKNPQTLLALAALYDDKKEYLQSEGIYETLIKMAPDNPMVLNNYAYHLAVRILRLDQAQEMVQKALQIEPDNPAYLDTAGWILFQMGMYAQAKEQIEKSIAIRADSAEVVEHLGDIYEKMGDLENAKIHWKKSLEMDGKRLHLLDKIQKSTPQTNQATPQ